ncbi:olfactomedin-like protein 2B-like [Scleropages formosus]|uniref:Olfactomedin-like protein 2B-like n=1 Tax=Scleropages formosus TaxID=113540 RepID=A0A0P7UUH5_SCLFO|nr:olfactomedin-like protein 2B-like [Scleropages formosus]
MKLLGDYEKVKAVSEGSDCACKCVVRPLSRSACRLMEREGSAQPEDFYTVETVTRGSDCKCACIAPPSALNPCEAELRLKKLRDAGQNGVKLSTVMELLEGSFYGMDLLKLHSVTTKLLNRVENLEKQVVSENHMKETVNLKETFYKEKQLKESQSHQHVEKKKHITELGDTAAAFVRTEVGWILVHVYAPRITSWLTFSSFSHRTHTKYWVPASDRILKKYEEKFVGNHGYVQPQLKRSQSSPPVEPKRMLEEQQITKHMRTRPHGTVVRGITFYKSNTVEEADPDEHWGTQSAHSTQAPRTEPAAVTMLPEPQPAYAINSVATMESVAWGTSLNTEAATTMTSATPTTTVPLTPTATLTSTTPTTSSTPTTTNTPMMPNTPNIAIAPTTPAHTVEAAITVETTAPATTTRATEPTMPQLTTSLTTMQNHITIPVASPTRAPSRSRSGKSKYSISWTESASQEELQQGPTETPGECKDTLATISEPVTHNTYGRSEGAWMKDPGAQDDKIYVTNYYYGNNLLEFQNMEVFKQGRFTNSYKLPYNWIGTGHVVYNGAFFYNRAFSRDIIKFDLRRRYVAAWTMLHDAIFEEATPWRWRGHSDIDFAVDESGLWVVYPAMDEEGYHQEVIMLSKLNPVDLTIQKETSWRTGLRKNFYGNCFVVCGVLYAVDKHDQMNANISYAFDTHTHTQMVPRLPFVNNYNYTTQIDYNPKDRLLYAWDNSHQVTYNVIFAY